MQVSLNRALQLAVLLATMFWVSDTTAHCQASLRMPVATITLHTSSAPEHPSYSLVRVPADDVVRDSEGIPQLPAWRFATYKASPSLQDLLSVNTNDTVFVSQSRVPLARFWGGRLQIAGFTSTVHMEDVVLGPASQSAVQSLRFTQQARFSAARSIDLYGVSVGFRLKPSTDTAGRASIRRLLESIKE